MIVTELKKIQYFSYLFISSLLYSIHKPHLVQCMFRFTLSPIKLYKFIHTGLNSSLDAFLFDIAINDISKWSTKNQESIPLTLYPRARICKPFRGAPESIPSLAGRYESTTLFFDVPARQAT